MIIPYHCHSQFQNKNLKLIWGERLTLYKANKNNQEATKQHTENKNHRVKACAVMISAKY